MGIFSKDDSLAKLRRIKDEIESLKEFLIDFSVDIWLIVFSLRIPVNNRFKTDIL